MASHIPRLWLPQPDFGSTQIVITEPARLHHLLNVLRLKPSDNTLLFHASYGEYKATLIEATKKSACFSIGDRVRAPLTLSPLHVYFAPLKRQATEWLIEKVTELGATDIHPVMTAHVQGHDLNIERLHSIAIQATEQCGNLATPALHTPVRLPNVLETITPAQPLFVALETAKDKAPLLHHALSAHTTINRILIGPEGGFSDTEIKLLKSTAGVFPVSLGSNILRAETAATLACGMLRLYASAA